MVMIVNTLVRGVLLLLIISKAFLTARSQCILLGLWWLLKINVLETSFCNLTILEETCIIKDTYKRSGTPKKIFDNQKIHYSTNTNQSVIHTLSIVDSSVEMAFAHVQERASSHARVTASVELRSSSSNSTCHLVSSNRSYKYKQKLNDSWIWVHRTRERKQLLYLRNHKVEGTKIFPFRWYIGPCIETHCPVSANHRAFCREKPSTKEVEH